ncbi:MAG: DUF4920 domain-containing protein, partial [Saprospiraceae bacterium]|nr:DUF4920 domain-containing protein [Saprospiraceae bacterium]
MKYGNITRFSLLTLVSLTLIFSVTNCTKKAAASVDNHHFGKNIVEKKPLTVDEVITKLKSGKGLNTQMKGTVEAVCQAKGCWMSLKSASDPSKLILVKFK